MGYCGGIPLKLYKTSFLLLVSLFFGVFALVFFLESIGISLGDLMIVGIDLNGDVAWMHVIKATIMAFLISGIANVFVMLEIIRRKRSIEKWPVDVAIVLVLLFPFEFVLGMVMVIPNIFYFGYRIVQKKSAIIN